MIRLLRMPVIALAVVLIGCVPGSRAFAAESPPLNAPVMPLSALEPGMTGTVWTVFRGTEPEPFEVEVTGVIENSLGPGKSMILCQLTDDRVQHMGAVAGMSGSPLYINGRLAGALSYQVQRFETVRFAGFTPAEDLLEVRRIAMDLSGGLPGSGGTLPAGQTPLNGESASATEPLAGGGLNGIEPLTPVFSFGGLSPAVTNLMAEPFRQLGLQTTGLGGAQSMDTDTMPAAEPAPLRAGQAVGAALAIGDITLAGTGTVSHVDGDRVLAFGHPLLGLGTVEVPMTTADIVAILPSNLSSFKIANTGSVIGTVRQDRLSAIYGEIGPQPEMVPVTVHTPARTLNFSTVRHPRLTPMITAAGLAQAVLGSNDAELSEGFDVTIDVLFPGGEELKISQLYAGPAGFQAGLNGLVRGLSTWLQNPVEEVFPANVEFTVTPLPANPTASLDNMRFSPRIAKPGAELTVTLGLRDFQSTPWTEQIHLPIAEDWTGRKLELVVTSGAVLDLLSGAQNFYPVSQIRDFDAYLHAINHHRRTDGLYIAVVTPTEVFKDQTAATLELPGSLARVARRADETRYSQREIREVLWETHVMPGRLVPGMVRRAFEVSP